MDAKKKQIETLATVTAKVTKAGGSCKVNGGGHARHVVIANSKGQSASVWFPEEPRYNNLEVADLWDAVDKIFGLIGK